MLTLRMQRFQVLRLASLRFRLFLLLSHAILVTIWFLVFALNALQVIIAQVIQKYTNVNLVLMWVRLMPLLAANVGLVGIALIME